MQTIAVNTSMRSAFENIRIKPSAFTVKGKEIAQNIQRGLATAVGINKVPAWNAHLSFKTAQKIGMKDGCTNPHAPMRVDAMLKD